jgi:DNA-binding GntR family transcriptional regulator
MTKLPDVREIHECAFDLSKVRWTSQDVAGVLGVSQSHVARTWRSEFRHHLALPELPLQIEIVEVQFSAQNLQLRFRAQEAAITQPLALNKAMRSARRGPLQLLVTGFASSHCYDQLDKDPQSTEEDSDRWIEFASPQAAKDALCQLIVQSNATQQEQLLDLQKQLRIWALDKSQPFVWREFLAPKHSATLKTTIASHNQVVADQVIETIIDQIRLGKLSAGSRIVESNLARALHTTRNQTRDALRNLAGSGLLDFHELGGITLPSPVRADVLEIYLARRTLGSEIVRRCCELPDGKLENVLAAHEVLVATAKSNDAYRTGEADLNFQQALARDSGLRTFPNMFWLLGNQLRIYIALLGYRYAYSIRDMVRDDSEILDLINQKQTNAAVAKWQQKMQAAYEYLAGQIS